MCASFVSVPCTRLGRCGGGAGGTILEAKPSIMSCLSMEANVGLFPGAAVPSE